MDAGLSEGKRGPSEGMYRAVPVQHQQSRSPFRTWNSSGSIRSRSRRERVHASHQLHTTPHVLQMSVLPYLPMQTHAHMDVDDPILRKRSSLDRPVTPAPVLQTGSRSTELLRQAPLTTSGIETSLKSLIMNLSVTSTKVNQLTPKHDIVSPHEMNS